jgi:hypothetical protein
MSTGGCTKVAAQATPAGAALAVWVEKVVVCWIARGVVTNLACGKR